MFSCSQEKQKTIAINVLLTPSAEMQAQALKLNTLIKENNPDALHLDKNHIPHITILQCFVKENDLPKINEALKGLYKNFQNESLKAKSLSYETDKEASFAMIAVEKSNALLALHKKTIELVEPFMVKEGSEKSFVQNPDRSAISASTVSYVPDFLDKYSYEKFEPHISLGIAQKVFLDSLAKNVFRPIHFKATSISIYQLGDHGTAQKLIYKLGNE